MDWFNTATRQCFKNDIESGKTPELPSIVIEAFFSTPAEEEIGIKKYKGTNNSLHEDIEGVKLEIIFDDQYSDVYRQLLSENKVKDIPVEYYKVVFRSFANPELYYTMTGKK